MLLRLWFVRHLALIAGDGLVYGDIAKNLLQHHIFGFTEPGLMPGSIEIRPTLIRLPGYPLFLAVCFRVFGLQNFTAVLYMQVAADLLTCLLAAALAMHLFGDRAALVALWLAALCPFTASYTAQPLTETLVLTTIAATLYTFARWQSAGRAYNHWLWIAAIPLASSILLRPEQVLFAASTFAAMLWTSLRHRPTTQLRIQTARPVFAAALCVLLPLIPWTIRNERTFHVFQPLAPRYANDPGELAPLGFARWYRTWAIDFADTENVYWNYPGAPIELGDIPPRAFSAGSPSASQRLRTRTAQVLADYNATGADSSEVIPAIDARFAALAAERIRAHPLLYYFVLPVSRVLDMVLRPRTEMMPVSLDWWAWTSHRAQTIFAAAYASLNFAYLAFAGAGFIAWKRRRWQHTIQPLPSNSRELAIAMAAAILLRAALLLTIDNSEPRYTLEFFPILFVCASALFATHPAQRAGR
ncbi:MAG TPA: glycosyltransferase family 39 protein [Acidobacteriaceae bacterium]|nr:glycosyltransferase family 39 protein [Acidobacteriaceae bacterium]